MSIDNILRRLKESRDTNIIDKYQDVASEIHQKVIKSVEEYMMSEGFSKEEVKDYTRIDATFQNEYLVIEVGAEVSYDGLMDLCDKLNPIVAAYDEESYFEPVDSGIISAWITLSDELLESSDNLSMEFATDEEAYEWAEANGYEVTKVQNNEHGEKSCLCWMKKINESTEEALSVDDMRKELVQYGDYTEEEARNLPVGKLMQAWTALPHDLKEDAYLSPFKKEVMDAVNAQAPKALYWKEGDQIKNPRNGAVGTFKGYIYVPTVKAYKAVIEREHNGKVEVSRYNLPHLQDDIEAGKLVNMSRSTKESKDTIVESSFGGSWEYWEMPKDYRGPWQQDHYYKDYGNDILGFIYPPFHSNNPRLKSEDHSDYIAMMWDNAKADVVEEKSFSKMKDARAWLDELANSILED